MKKNELYRYDGSILRVLDVKDEKVFVIDCLKRTMPAWMCDDVFAGAEGAAENELRDAARLDIVSMEELSPECRKVVYERYTAVAGVLPYVSDDRRRSESLHAAAEQEGISIQTVRRYLCLFLAFQDIAVLAPKQKDKERALTQDEKNFRWALNKFYYTRARNSLDTAYTMMLKAKYCNDQGKLVETYPSFYRFRYFYRNHKKLETYYISREGIKSYQRDHRPLTGGTIQDYASFVGMAMFDATVCDIYLVNEAGQLVGRPILTAAVDGYSGLCVGYFLSWEGGVYSLRNLVANILDDKMEVCIKHGIETTHEQWPSSKLPSVFITDLGTEYTSGTFEQITELGVTVVNLPAYRPELKGNIEKLFDLVQDAYKPYLKHKGVIEPDFQERGAPDYRKDACLTMKEFEKIILRCILYYNCETVLKSYPFTLEMLTSGIRPYANEIYQWGIHAGNVSLIDVSKEQAMLTLLPRTEGVFSRKGFKVNGLRYHAEGFKERYLRGGKAMAAYNPENSNSVWLVEKGRYTEFSLIESRFSNKTLEEVTTMKAYQADIIKAEENANRQAKIDLARHIETIAGIACKNDKTSIRGIRDNRRKERMKLHMNLLEGGNKYD